ncbi:MAG: methylmalonyl Co-A mutase-associated GTPase MeaB [Candidatus Kapabacteria bacterium]|nr:methylmalonyl Co-A mutase-associated GTPase MeaB [Candidatus Kapabacteria bacterium]
MKKSKINTIDLYEKIITGDKQALSKAITLVESSLDEHIELAQKLLNVIIPKTGNSIRIGISGPPGAGKSTFINKFGLYLCEKGIKVAVLTIDPSSSISKGSILGDKTRMADLSVHNGSFIRPSPSGETMGGVARKTRESLLLCEAAGFDIIFIETVGVGQNETLVRSMVDLFVLILSPGAGDELQGIKKGIVEISDMILVNKTDGPNEQAARLTRKEYETGLHLSKSPSDGWTQQALNISAETGLGLAELWLKINEFVTTTKAKGTFSLRRKKQLQNWFDNELQLEILRRIGKRNEVLKKITESRIKISDGKQSVYSAVYEISSLIFNDQS